MSIKEVEPYITINDPELIKLKNEMREKLRYEYIKRWTNPYRHATGTGGLPFDPQVQRYASMYYTQIEYFKPTVKSGLCFLAMFAIPYAYMYIHWGGDKRKQERDYRGGIISYRDRDPSHL